MKQQAERMQRGAVAVEFALIAPLLLLLVFGIFQFGWLFNNYLMLTQATSAGSRLFSTQRGYDNPCTAAYSAVISAASTLTASSITMSCSVNGAAACSSCASGTCSTDTSCKSLLTSNAGNPSSITVNYAMSNLVESTFSALKIPSVLTIVATDRIQ
jgi:Flp pilus assembly protein TadG